MRLPSAVTLASAALLAAAGVGLAAWAVADELTAPDAASASASKDSGAEESSAGGSSGAGAPGNGASSAAGATSDPAAGRPSGPPGGATSSGPSGDSPGNTDGLREPNAGPRTEPQQEKARQTKPAKPDPDLVPQVLVEVYNNSGITGLAAEKASLLQGAGWNVGATDNWYGSIPENTVYYPEGLRPDADKLAKALGLDRVQPAVAPMSFDRLTVIFTSA